MLTNAAELAAAAARLEAITSALAAQTTGAAAATTVVTPAAADPVSFQQAAIFSTFGTQFQTVAAGAQTQQEQYANNLGTSSGTYANTEAQNALQALAGPADPASSSSSDPPPSLLSSIYGFLSGNGLFQGSGGLAVISQDEMGNWASAYSDTIGMGGGGLLSAIQAPTDAGGDIAGLAGATDLAGTTGPAVAPMAGVGAMPVAAGVGQATMVGKLSVPPSWAGTVTPMAAASAAPIQTVGWTAAAPQAGTGAIIPGMPGVGAAARNSAGFGAPRYGVKPIVMPKPTAVV
jgi:hypothetical protein